MPSNYYFLVIVAEWSPTFTGYEGKQNVKVDEYRYLIGNPDCGKMQMWPVYHDPEVRFEFQPFWSFLIIKEHVFRITIICSYFLMGNLGITLRTIASPIKKKMKTKLMKKLRSYSLNVLERFSTMTMSRDIIVSTKPSTQIIQKNLGNLLTFAHRKKFSVGLTRTFYWERF